MIDSFLAALEFLTLVPVPGRATRAGGTAIFFPLVGALLGLSAAGVLVLLNPHVGRSLSALLGLGWLMVITGCLHEDGLADVADALRAGRSREKMMQILKDSRIGTYGGIALVLSSLVRWQGLGQGAIDPWRGLPAVLALSRASMVVMAHIAPPVSEGLGKEFALGCTRMVTLIVVAQAVALSFLTGWRWSLVMILASGLTIWWARIYFMKRLGGVNGDCLGATCLMVETVNLVVLAWR